MLIAVSQIGFGVCNLGVDCRIALEEIAVEELAKTQFDPNWDQHRMLTTSRVLCSPLFSRTDLDARFARSKRRSARASVSGSS